MLVSVRVAISRRMKHVEKLRGSFSSHYRGYATTFSIFPMALFLTEEAGRLS
jgi:hypothetical protein